LSKKRSARRSRPVEEHKPLVSTQMIVIVAAVALVITGGLILLGNMGGDSGTINNVAIDADEFPTKGDPNAPVTIVEYSDYGCGHCQAFTRETLPLLEEEYIETGKVKHVIHPYYLGNPQIGQIAEANYCAVEQDMYFEYREAIFKNTNLMLNRSGLIEIARGVDGLDAGQIDACLSAGTYQNTIASGRAAATRRGVNSTPTFFINGQRVEGNQPYERLKQLIDQQIAQVGS